MSDSETKALNEISGRIGNLEGTTRATNEAMRLLTEGVNRLVDKMDASDDIAKEALEKAKSAHHRITETNQHYDEHVKTIYTRFEKAEEEKKSDRKWRIGTAISIGALTVSIIGLGITIIVFLRG